jgi:hypothetical protein
VRRLAYKLVAVDGGDGSARLVPAFKRCCQDWIALTDILDDCGKVKSAMLRDVSQANEYKQLTLTWVAAIENADG